MPMLMIYDSGGGFDSGASSDPKIDGSYLAARVSSQAYHLSIWLTDSTQRESFSQATITDFRYSDSRTLKRFLMRGKLRTLGFSILGLRQNGWLPM